MTDVAPLPIATSVITAETPMIMPSMVKAVRILLRPSALKAMRKVMTGDIANALSRRRHHREARRPVRGIHVLADP